MNDENIIIVAPSEDYKPIRLFQDQNNKECNYSTLFFGMFRKPSILAKYWYQDIVNGNSCIKIIDLIDIYQTCFLRPLRFVYNKSNLPLGSKYIKAS